MSRPVYSVDQEIVTEQLSSELWVARFPTFDIEVFGATENDAMHAVVPRFTDAVMALSEDERSAWFAVSTSLDPNPPFDADACFGAFGRDGEAFELG